MQVTANELVARIRLRTDQVNSPQFTDEELQTFIYESANQLYEIITLTYKDWYTTPTTLDLAFGQEAYDLPNNTRRVEAVYIMSANGNRFPLIQFTKREFRRNVNRGLWAQWGIMYRIMRNKIYFTPIPNNNDNVTVELWITPGYKKPANPDDPMDDVLPPGWEEWIICDVAVKMMVRLRLKEQSDAFMAARKEAEKRVIDGASNRSADPLRSPNIYRDSNGGWSMGGPGRY